MTQHLPWLAVDIHVVDHLRADLVIIIFVVRRILEIPDDLAGIGIDGEGRVGVEIVPWPVLGIKHRCRLPRAPIHQVRRWIISSDIPERAAARLPSVVVVSPGLMAWLPWSGDRVGSPESLPGFGVDRHQPTAPANVGTRPGNEDHV